MAFSFRYLLALVPPPPPFPRLPVNTSPGGTPLSSATSSYVASRNGNGPTSNASSDAGDFDDARSEMSANSSIPSTSTPMTDMGMAPGFDAMRSAAGTPEVWQSIRAVFSFKINRTVHAIVC